VDYRGLPPRGGGRLAQAVHGLPLRHGRGDGLHVRHCVHHRGGRLGVPHVGHLLWLFHRVGGVFRPHPRVPLPAQLFLGGEAELLRVHGARRGGRGGLRADGPVRQRLLPGGRQNCFHGEVRPHGLRLQRRLLLQRRAAGPPVRGHHHHYRGGGSGDHRVVLVHFLAGPPGLLPPADGPVRGGAGRREAVKNRGMYISGGKKFRQNKTNNNPLTGLYTFARDKDFASYKENYQVFDQGRNLYKQSWYSTYEFQNNPYFELNNNSKLATNNRVIANLKLSYDIMNHVKFETRANIDYNDVLYDNRYAAGGNSVSVSPNGSWSYSKYKDQSLYADAILTYNNNFGNFSLTGLLGASYQNNTFGEGMNVANGTIPLQYPNFFSFSNMPYNVIFNSTINKTVKQGVFASANIGYKEVLFLDVSARNDWASTLALTGNQSYLYPAFGLSAVISQMIQLPEAISYLKVRASNSKTGNEVPFNVVNPWNSIGGAGGPSGIGGINRNSQVPFTNLNPEIITSNELGTDIKFFNGRLGFDFTYYNSVSTNQFLSLAAPSGSGYSSYFVNAGKIVNKGFELTIDAQPFRTDNFAWNTNINLSRNQNEIVELIASNPNYQVGGDDEGFASIIKAGGSFQDLYIFKFNRNSAGQIILSPAGVPTKAATQVKVGNVNPDLIAGWNHNLSYKNFFVSALINAKFGGVAFSKTEAFLDSYGASQRSADARLNATIPINAVSSAGTAVTSIDPVLYYSAIGDRNKIMEPYVFSRTNVRLGQLAFGYNLKINKTSFPIKDASFSLVARNLFFFYKEAPFDPEQSMSTGNGMQSNDVFSMPSTRSIGFNVKLTF